MHVATMPDWLAQRAQLTPGRVALVGSREQITFAELDRRIAGIAAWLGTLGVEAGDRVAILLSNGLPFAELVHAVPRAGAILVPLNTRLSPDELAYQLSDAGARLLIHDDAHADQAMQAARTAQGTRCWAAEERTSDAPDRAPLDIDLDRIHSVIYTSGTTGRPKGAMLTYGNYWWNATTSALNLGIEPADRWLAVLPLFHVGGLSILLRSVIYGTTAQIHERFDPAAVNRAIDEEGVTMVSVVSAMLQRMLDERDDRPYPSTLRCVLTGGGPVPVPLLVRSARFGVPVVQTYGLTETASQAATLPPEDALHKLGSAGKPLFGTHVRIEASDERQTSEIGEILIRGPIVTPGYWDRPEESARVLRDGWLHTGDLGSLDEEGYLTVVDRREDLIVSGGENVYPAEVEAVLRSHPDIGDAGVTGIVDARWGQVPVALVVLRGQNRFSEDGLRDFCRERLAAYKVPVRIVAVESLPCTASGKLLRRELASLLPSE